MSVLASAMKFITMGVSSMFSNKATFITEEGEVLHAQFNPEQFRITKSAQYHQTIRKENEKSYMEFSGIAVPQLEISFFFDTSESKDFMGKVISKESDVSTLTEQFANLVRVKPKLHRPPMVFFIWGSTFFPGVVRQVSATYIMFNKNGMPIRAKVDAIISGVEESGTDTIPLESPDRTKSRVVSDETSIWGLANNEYDDISKWRVIAKANGIMDPFDIPAGTALKVPALKEEE